MTAQFLTKGGVRNAALGGTGISSSNDLSGAIWNPSLLGQLSSIELLTDSRKFFWNLDNDNLGYNFASIGYPFGSLGTVGLSGSFFYGSNYSENKIGLHYGNSFFNNIFSIGFSIYNFNKGFEYSEFTRNDPFYELFGYRKNIFDGDIGITIKPARNFRIGLIGANLLQSDLALNPDDRDYLPFIFGTGFTYKWNDLTLIMDVLFEKHNQTKLNETIFAAGMEYQLFPGLAIRVGKDNYRFSAGFGLNIFAKEWTDKFIDPFSSTEFINIKGLKLILDYCFQYPISNIYSSYGDHFVGVRINFFNSTTELDKLSEKVPPKIEKEKEFVATVKVDTVYQYRVKIDTMVKQSILRDTVRVLDDKMKRYLLSKARQLRSAKSELETMKNWNKALTHLLFALKYYYSEKYQQAITECKTAIQLAPKLVLAYVRLGSIYYRLGDYGNARRYWNIAKRIDPQNPELNDIPEGF